MNFNGDFDLLPIRAQLLFAAVPEYPVESDFHMAASDLFANPDEPAAHWRLEAVRARLHNPGTKLDDLRAEINRETAASLYKQATAY